MRKTKLSFDLFARQHGNDGLFTRFYRHPGPAILLQKQFSKASIAKIVGVSLPPPLYQGKAVTPTPLKDIFTPIWAGPRSGGSNGSAALATIRAFPASPKSMSA